MGSTELVIGFHAGVQPLTQYSPASAMPEPGCREIQNSGGFRVMNGAEKLTVGLWKPFARPQSVNFIPRHHPRPASRRRATRAGSPPVVRRRGALMARALRPGDDFWRVPGGGALYTWAG